MRHSALALLALSLLPGLPLRADDWSREYPIKGRADVRVTTDDGSVTVEGGDGGVVRAWVTTRGWRLSPEEVTITESQQGDRVELTVRLPRRLDHGWWEEGRSREIAVRLQVPRDLDLDVHTGDGNVRLASLSGRVRVFTGDGNIDATAARGDVFLRTGDGSIHGHDLGGRLEAQTGDGRIELHGRFEILNVRTGDGHIEADIAEGSRVAGPWSLRSGDGGITLRLPEGLGAELDANAGDGHIDLDVPVAVEGTIRRSAVRGRLGAGGPLVRVQTGDGSIRLRRL